MVEKWCRMKCRLTDWHLEPILIIISIHGFEDFISYPRCRSLAGHHLKLISSSDTGPGDFQWLSRQSSLPASCPAPPLSGGPAPPLSPRTPPVLSGTLGLPSGTSCTINGTSCTNLYLMYHWWFYLLFCTSSEKSHSKVYPPVCIRIEHPLLYPQWLAPKLQGTTSKLPRRPVGTNPKISLPEETNLDRMGHGVSPAWHLVHCHQRWKWCLLDLTKTSFNLLPPWRSHICKYKHKLQQFVCEEWASVEFIQ